MGFQLSDAREGDVVVSSPSGDRGAIAPLPDSGTVVSADGLTPARKGVTLWVPRGGQGAKKIEAARKIGQIEIPLVGQEEG